MRLKFNLWVWKIPWRGNGNPLQYSCLENSMDRKAWQAPVHGVSKCQIWLSNSHFHCYLMGRARDAAKYSILHKYSKWTKIHPVQNFNSAEAEKHWCKGKFLLWNHFEVHFEVSQLFFAKWIVTKKSVVDDAIVKVKVLSCLTLCDPVAYTLWNPGVGSLSLLQEIFPTQELNPALPHCRQML